MLNRFLVSGLFYWLRANLVTTFHLHKSYSTELTQAIYHNIYIIYIIHIYIYTHIYIYIIYTYMRERDLIEDCEEQERKMKLYHVAVGCHGFMEKCSQFTWTTFWLQQERNHSRTPRNSWLQHQFCVDTSQHRHPNTFSVLVPGLCRKKAYRKITRYKIGPPLSLTKPLVYKKQRESNFSVPNTIYL